MKIGALQKFTLVDYPGRLACTVFLVGCPFRCPWCHNPELVVPERTEKLPSLEEKDILDFLNTRVGELEGVVLTGGEPTIHPELPSFCKRIKELGYDIKLDTNGSNPDMLRELVEERLVNYVAMDVKAPKDRYLEVIGLEGEYKYDDVNRSDFWKGTILNNVEESVDFLKRGEVDYEFRTTLVPNLLSKEDVKRIAEWISPASRYFVQEFKPGKKINSDFKPSPKEDGYLEEVFRAVKPLFDECRIRRA